MFIFLLSKKYIVSKIMRYSSTPITRVSWRPMKQHEHWWDKSRRKKHRPYFPPKFLGGAQHELPDTSLVYAKSLGRVRDPFKLPTCEGIRRKLGRIELCVREWQLRGLIAKFLSQLKVGKRTESFTNMLIQNVQINRVKRCPCVEYSSLRSYLNHSKKNL